MPVLVRIAFRNLLEHKSKSFIIGVLLALGVATLVVGKALMDTAAQGIKDTFTANYTGDIFIAPKTDSPVSLFGIQTIDRQESVPDIPFYDKIVKKLSAEKEITGFTSQVTSFAMASPKDSDKQGLALLFGIDPASYYRLFHNAYAVEGRLLEPGEEGLMISQYMADRYATADGFRPRIGETLLLTGTGKDGFKIRAVTLVGILGYKTKSEATDLISFADVNTVRILSGLTLGNDPDEPVTAAQEQILEASGDSLFGCETVLSPSTVRKPVRAVAASRGMPKRVAQADTGAWHFIMARVENPAQARGVILALNHWFEDQSIEARAAGWKAAAGPFATSIDVVRVAFDAAIIITAVVSLIIMMNTLVISVIERTGEIGTMRALGAQKSFVRSIFLAETLTIAFVFEAIGLALAFAIVGLLDLAHIRASNPFLRILFAGDLLHPAIDPLSVAWSLALVGMIAVLAHLYPVSLALKVQPLRAMQTE